MDALPMVKGTLDFLVLKALTLSSMHGFEVVSWLEARSGGKLGIDDSAVYQALYRMEGRGLIDVSWGVTENNRRARYYAITSEGRKYLKTQTAQWLTYVQTVSGILTTPATR